MNKMTPPLTGTSYLCADGIWRARRTSRDGIVFEASGDTATQAETALDELARKVEDWGAWQDEI